MSIPDHLLEEWFKLLTDRPMEEVKKLVASKPMEAKKLLGVEIVSCYHPADKAAGARADWEKQFSQKQDPDQIDEVSLPAADLTDGTIWVCKLLTLIKLAKSNNEARQKVQEGAFNIGPERTKVTDPKANVPVADGLIVRLGRHVRRIRLS